MKRKKLIAVLSVIIFCFGLYVYWSISNRAVHTGSSIFPDNDEFSLRVKQGRLLADQYCGTCHMLPDPSLLNKRNWPLVIEQMKISYGIFQPDGDHFNIYADFDHGFYAPNPTISQTELYQILDYYSFSAPVVLQQEERLDDEIKELTSFTVHKPPGQLYKNGNTATFIKIDSSSFPLRIFAHRAESNTLYLINEKFQITDSLIINGAVVDMDIQGDEIAVCVIGPDLRGTDEKLGRVFHLQIDQQGKMRKKDELLFDGLARPVQIKSVNLSKNGDNDYLISEFGFLHGGLSWMEYKPDGSHLRHDIRPVAGAVRAYIQNNANTGLPDIWALFAQGNEGIFYFRNKGNGEFEQRQVLQFPPTYGSTSFDLVDFNGNGSLDIIYTAGDRGDGIPQYKPYHGVYLYLNNGYNEFTQRFFFPLNGAIKAVARDFNGNGNLDIAAIGYFLHDRKQEERFVFLENQGDFVFQPYFLPIEIKFQRALSMDVADINGNGKPDIILGNGFVKDETSEIKEPLFIVLENRY